MATRHHITPFTCTCTLCTQCSRRLSSLPPARAAFVILTDNETWHGDQTPAEALLQYRAQMNLPTAKLIVMAFSVSDFSIADPSDAYMLDIAGLDSAVPRIMAEFAAGKL